MYFLNEQLLAATQVVSRSVRAGKSISLFLEGVPGSGKTAFAKYIACELGSQLHRYDCNAESNSGIMVSFDLEGIVTRKGAYLKGPLWEAFESATPAVVLIDEVDKSPRDFEAFLLRVTDEQSFRSPQNTEIQAAAPVVFVFSSNGRRQMSPEFLRRCFRLTVEYPKGEILRHIVSQEMPWGFPGRVSDLLCRIAEAMLGKVEPDQMPSPKEIAWCAASLRECNTPAQVAACFSGFMLKGMTAAELNQIVKFDCLKAVGNELAK